MVQVRVVENDEPGILEDVWPHEVVAAGVPELVDDESYGAWWCSHTNSCAERAGRCVCARSDELGGATDEDVDVMRGEHAGSASTE